MADRITISGLRIPVRIGCSAAERAAPQAVRIDIGWVTDFRRGAQEDRPDRMEDYASVAAAVRRFAESREWRLIEALAHGIAGVVIGLHPHVRVRVAVQKLGTFVQDAEAVVAECERTGDHFPKALASTLPFEAPAGTETGGGASLHSAATRLMPSLGEESAAAPAFGPEDPLIPSARPGGRR